MFLVQRGVALVHPTLLLELEIYIWFYNLIFHLTTTYHKHLSTTIQEVFAALASSDLGWLTHLPVRDCPAQQSPVQICGLMGSRERLNQY